MLATIAMPCNMNCKNSEPSSLTKPLKFSDPKDQRPGVKTLAVHVTCCYDSCQRNESTMITTILILIR